MNNMKMGVLACGVVGLIACFLPFVSFGDQSMSVWGMHVGPDGAQAYMVMAGFAAAAVMGAMGVAKPPMLRWQSIVATVGFAFVIFKFRDGFTHLITDGAIGAKLIGVAAIAGLALSIVTIAKPDTTK